MGVVLPGGQCLGELGHDRLALGSRTTRRARPARPPREPVRQSGSPSPQPTSAARPAGSATTWRCAARAAARRSACADEGMPALRGGGDRRGVHGLTLPRPLLPTCYSHPWMEVKTSVGGGNVRKSVRCHLHPPLALEVNRASEVKLSGRAHVWTSTARRQAPGAAAEATFSTSGLRVVTPSTSGQPRQPTSRKPARRWCCEPTPSTRGCGAACPAVCSGARWRHQPPRAESVGDQSLRGARSGPGRAVEDPRPADGEHTHRSAQRASPALACDI